MSAAPGCEPSGTYRGHVLLTDDRISVRILSEQPCSCEAWPTFEHGTCTSWSDGTECDCRGDGVDAVYLRDESGVIAMSDGLYQFLGFDLPRSSVEGELHLELDGAYGKREVPLPPVLSTPETTTLTLEPIDDVHTDITWTPSGTADMTCFTTNHVFSGGACCGDDSGAERDRTGAYLRVFLYRVWELSHHEDAGVSFTVWQASVASAEQW